MFGSSYVLAALVFVVCVCGAGYAGWHERDKLAVAETQRVVAEAAQKAAEAKQQNAEVSQKVVTVYKDRIVKIREVPPEVQHEVQVIRDSGCVVSREWVRLHNDAAGSEAPTTAGVDDSAACADAIEAVRANYKAARENAAQLEALQEWAKGVSSTSAP